MARAIRAAARRRSVRSSQKYQTSIVEHAIDPDLWRTAGWEQEPPRHFLDMDAYGPYPFPNFPREQDEAIKRYGADFVVKNGQLPWRAAEIYQKLVEAFRQQAPYSRDNIKFFSSVLTHYVSDAHVPFHAVLNYDGQLTGQCGHPFAVRDGAVRALPRHAARRRRNPSCRSPTRANSSSRR